MRIKPYPLMKGKANMSRFFDKRFSFLTPYVPGEQPKDINKLIKLNTNENPYPPSPRVTEILRKVEANSLKFYPDPTNASLVKAIADYNNVSPSQVVLGNGSDEILAFCFHAFCEKGAAFADITYGFYKVFAEMFCREYESIPLRNDYSIGIDDYKDTRSTIFIANPNAPTGMLLSQKEIESLLKQNTNRLIIIDEAYIDFGGKSAIPLLKNYDNLIVVQTFSKSRCLAGARLGYAIATEELAAELNAMKFSFNPYNINSLTMLIGQESVEDVKYFDYCNSLIIETRDYTALELQKLGFDVLESKANFLFVKHKEFKSGEDYYLALKKKGILVRYFNLPRIKNFVRISIGTTGEMESLLSATKDILKEV